MKKKMIACMLCLMVFVICFSSMVGYAQTSVGDLGAFSGDVGNHNTYGGGGGGGGHTTFSGGGFSGIFLLGGGTVGIVTTIIVIVVIVIIAAVIRSKKKNSNVGGGFPVNTNNAIYVPNHTAEIVEAIKLKDPAFSSDDFIGYSKEIFISLQQAWTERDWEKIRPFETEELFNQHAQQLQEYVNLGRINIIERINVNQSYLYQYIRESEYEYLTTYLDVRMGDYIIDEKTKAVLKGDPNQEYRMQYLLTFKRKNDILTTPASDEKKEVACPHCGAPTKITSAGRCEFCDSVITTGDHDWALSNLDSVNQSTMLNQGGVFYR